MATKRLRLTFLPEASEFKEAADQYHAIWDTEGDRMTSAIEKLAGLEFQVLEVLAGVFEGISQSEPLRLRASNTEADKKAVIVHELCHRLIDENEVAGNVRLLSDSNESLAAHKQIDLFLYDAWIDLYGDKFANDQVERREKSYAPFYAEAWEWALTMSLEERQKLLHSLK
jgi:hypothetical protein